jgi:hypothetical protein
MMTQILDPMHRSISSAQRNKFAQARAERDAHETKRGKHVSRELERRKTGNHATELEESEEVLREKAMGCSAYLRGGAGRGCSETWRRLRWIGGGMGRGR